MEPPTRRPLTWSALVFMIFILLVLGGVAAIAWSPLVTSFFGGDESPATTPPPPSEQVPGAPGPDNTITTAPPLPTAPGPDNTITEAPRGDTSSRNDASTGEPDS